MKNVCVCCSTQSESFPQTKSYTITREQFLELYNLSPASHGLPNKQLEERIKKYLNINLFSSNVILGNQDLKQLYHDAYGSDKAIEWLQKYLPKPKQKVEVDVWVNVSETSTTAYISEKEAKSYSTDTINILHLAIPGKLTYEI